MPSSRGFSTTQGLNPDLPHCRQILYHHHLSQQGSPILHDVLNFATILQWIQDEFFFFTLEKPDLCFYSKGTAKSMCMIDK